MLGVAAGARMVPTAPAAASGAPVAAAARHTPKAASNAKITWYAQPMMGPPAPMGWVEAAGAGPQQVAPEAWEAVAAAEP